VVGCHGQFFTDFQFLGPPLQNFTGAFPQNSKFSLDYKGLQSGMAAQPIGSNKYINQKDRQLH